MGVGACGCLAREGDEQEKNNKSHFPGATPRYEDPKSSARSVQEPKSPAFKGGVGMSNAKGPRVSPRDQLILSTYERGLKDEEDRFAAKAAAAERKKRVSLLPGMISPKRYDAVINAFHVGDGSDAGSEVSSDDSEVFDGTLNEDNMEREDAAELPKVAAVDAKKQNAAPGPQKQNAQVEPAKDSSAPKAHHHRKAHRRSDSAPAIMHREVKKLYPRNSTRVTAGMRRQSTGSFAPGPFAAPEPLPAAAAPAPAAKASAAEPAPADKATPSEAMPVTSAAGWPRIKAATPAPEAAAPAASPTASPSAKKGGKKSINKKATIVEAEEKTASKAEEELPVAAAVAPKDAPAAKPATKPAAATAPAAPAAAPADASPPAAAPEGDSEDALSVKVMAAAAALTEAAEAPAEKKTTPIHDIPGESWIEFQLRSEKFNQASGLSDDPVALFEAFRVSEDLRTTYAAFARLFHLASGSGGAAGRRGSGSAASPPWASPLEVPDRRWHFPYEPIRLLLGGNWKAKKIWKILDDRAARPEYADAPCAKGKMEGKRAVVVGAGPCGLRAAIELRLLGAQVTVVESREAFTRINQLHIWSWVGEDMRGLCARLIEPPPSSFGANPDLLHVCINDLQKLLFKVCLLLGVEVLLGTAYVETQWDSENRSWRTICSAGTQGTEGRAGEAVTAAFKKPTAEPPSPRAPTILDDVAVVLGSNGFGSKVGEDVGMSMTTSGGLNNETAIGIIANLVRTNGKGEKDLRSFAMAKQFYMDLFKDLTKTTGANLENIVYVKGEQSHYFVMTPTRSCMIETGIAKDKKHQPLLARENIDMQALDSVIRKIAGYKFKKDQPTILGAVEADLPGADLEGLKLYADSGPRLFDFSKMCRCNDGVMFVQPPTGDGEDGEELFVGLVGDALMEPFWPEGLGVIRGFFGALDVCSSLDHWVKGDSPDQVRAHFDNAFTQLKTISAATRARVMQGDERTYRLDPATRYRQFKGGKAQQCRGAVFGCQSPRKREIVSRSKTSPY